MTNAIQQLLDAFRRKDTEQAKALAARARSAPPAEIESAIDELQQEVDADPGTARELGAILKELTAAVRVPQSELQRKMLPRIRQDGKLYRKFKEVHARKAEAGEKIASVTGDGHETENTAKAGDWIVRNTTRAKEQYIVSGEKFAARYRRLDDVDERWGRYRPIGEVLAVEVDSEVLDLLGKPAAFFIEAPWGEAQRVREGDELAAPPALNEVYRIARAEFEETYKRAPDT